MSPFFNSGTIQSILQTSLGGAGIILAIISMVPPIFKHIFGPLIREQNEKIKQTLESVKGLDPTSSANKFNELSKNLKKHSTIPDAPKWFSITLRGSFLTYTVSLILCTFYDPIGSSFILDMTILITFITATILLFIVSWFILNKAYNVMPHKYDEKLKITYDFISGQVKTKLFKEYNFETDVIGQIPQNWNIQSKGSGTIQVTDEDAANGTKQSLFIHSPENSRDTIETIFDPLTKFRLEYSLKQITYGDKRGAGIGLMIYSNGTQAIWMAIWQKLFHGWWDGIYRPIKKISLNTWYKIRVDVDCTKQEYSCYVNDEMQMRGKFRHPVESINRIITPGWLNQAERKGYLDEIRILDETLE